MSGEENQGLVDAKACLANMDENFQEAVKLGMSQVDANTVVGKVALADPSCAVAPASTPVAKAPYQDLNPHR